MMPIMSDASISVELLEGFPLLDGVGLPARRDLVEAAEERRVPSGVVLINQGQPNQTMYLLVEGELAVYLGDPEGDPVAVVGAGEIVGEMSLLDGSVASANVVSHTGCTLLAVSEQAFWTLINDSHAFAVRLLVSLSERLRANNATVSSNVEKRRMYERAAMFDGLTGIHNRRWLDETLHRLELRYRKSPDQELSVSLIDIDHFKRFNDTYGHDAGDHVLRLVAARLAQAPGGGTAYRYGGEEFALVFPGKGVDECVPHLEELRETVETSRFTMRRRFRPRVKPKMDKGRRTRQQITITVSIGVAERNHRHASPDQVVQAADKALYRAKEAGRNRVAT
jgi:diguanylate cyclase (GGDEF)-like protein